MRGKGYLNYRSFSRNGITPAYAGKSPVWTHRTPSCQDHPRLCGEKIRIHRVRQSFTGSPPPMRGKVTSFTTQSHNARITPAYAGKSSFQNRSFSSREDHPRLCGEKRMIDLSVSWVRGSPPPMRGKVICRIVFKSYPRITPAYAGKSKLPDKIRFRLSGSPPPMRGKADRTRNKEGRNRITPAYAGKRSILYDAIDTMRDHPRLCGEKGESNDLFQAV